MLIITDTFIYDITDSDNINYHDIIEWINSTDIINENHKYIMKELIDIKYTGKIIIRNKVDNKCTRKIYIINGIKMMINNIEKNEEYYLNMENDNNTELLYNKNTNMYTLYYENNTFCILYEDLIINIKYYNIDDNKSFVCENMYTHELTELQIMLIHHNEEIIENTKNNIIHNVINNLILS
jgi:hypothetical protein